MKYLLALFLFLAACSTTPTTPQQTVYDVKSTYAAALQVAVAYKSLPTCSPVSPPLCSKPDIVAKLRQADDVAFQALQAAENTVRSPGAGANAQTAVVAAQQAVAALTAITATLTTK